VHEAVEKGDGSCDRATVLATFRADEVLLDNCSSVCIFRNKNLLTDIHPCQVVEVGGVDSEGGEGLRATSSGKFASLAEVYHHPMAAANILSMAQLVDNGAHVSYHPSPRDAFTLVTPDGSRTFEFARRKVNSHSPSDELKRFYTCTGAGESRVRERAMLGVTSARDNAAEYSRREVKAATEARELQSRLGYPTTAAAAKMVGTGVIECPVSAPDLHRADAIHGPAVEAVKGRATQPTPRIAHPKLLAGPHSGVIPDRSQLTAHLDIMFLHGLPILVGVLLPMEFTVVIPLWTGRGVAAMRAALSELRTTATEHGHHLGAIYCDGEKAVGSLRATLVDELGVLPEVCGPGQHVPVAERKQRMLKERVRTHVHKLPYTLDPILSAWCAVFCGHRVNMQFTAAHPDGPSPFELFYGRKVNYKLDLRHSFGEYAQVVKPTTDNTMDARTRGCILLVPTGNSTGTSFMLHLATGRVVRGDHFTVIPVPDVVVDALDERARRAGVTRGADPTRDGPAAPLEEPEGGVEACAEGQQQQQRTEGMAPSAAPSHVAATPLYDPDGPHTGVIPCGMPPPPATPPEDKTESEAGDWVVEVWSDSEDESPPVPTARALRQERRWGVLDAAMHVSVKAAKRLYGQQAEESIDAEMQQLLDNDTWTPRHPHSLTTEERAGVIRSHMFIKEKVDADTGVLERIKSRLVAGGNQQDRSLYDDLSAPTASTTSVMTFMALAAHERRLLMTLDIKGAFLHADLKHTGVKLLMRLDREMTAVVVRLLPEMAEFVDERGCLVVHLDKALYGLVEAAILWYKDLRATLEGHGFAPNPADPCVFNRLGTDGLQCTVLMHVDDLAVSSRATQELDSVRDVLRSAYGELSEHRGERLQYLGIVWDFSQEGEVRATMAAYEKRMLEECGVEGTARTPATDDLFDRPEGESAVCETDRAWFHSYVARMLYLAKHCRLECLPAVACLSTRVSAPTPSDVQKLKRVLRYVRGTAGTALVLRIGEGGVSVSAYVDASHAVHSDRKSHTGVAVVVGEGACVLAKSTKQKIVTKSSTEAELVGASDSAGCAYGVQRFLEGQGYTLPPITLAQDNQSTIALLKKGRSTSDRTRHIDVRHFWLSDRVAAGELNIEYLPTESMGRANCLTKPLQGAQFARERAELLGHV
jgi:hypothetical protein